MDSSADTVELLPPADFKKLIDSVKAHLEALPSHIPEGPIKYNFEGFEADPKKSEDLGGDDYAINWVLEATFCPNGRLVPIVFTERGDGLVAVADVLEKYGKESILLQKFARDFIAGAKAVVRERSLAQHSLM